MTLNPHRLNNALLQQMLPTTDILTGRTQALLSHTNHRATPAIIQSLATSDCTLHMSRVRRRW